jgi:hypothetical protein
MKPSMVAAVEVARRVGIDSTMPTLVQETNNTVVWLRPHEVIAKVGTYPDSAGVLAHEPGVVALPNSALEPPARLRVAAVLDPSFVTSPEINKLPLG